jgi:hypothetical protein
MTTELSTTTTKQSFIKLTGENWDICKFQTLNYFSAVQLKYTLSKENLS